MSVSPFHGYSIPIDAVYDYVAENPGATAGQIYRALPIHFFPCGLEDVAVILRLLTAVHGGLTDDGSGKYRVAE